MRVVFLSGLIFAGFSGCAANLSLDQLRGGSRFGGLDLRAPGPPRREDLQAEPVEVKPGIWRVEYPEDSEIHPPTQITNGKVWDPQGGGEVDRPGTSYYGIARRALVLTGHGLEIREEQRKEYSAVLPGKVDLAAVAKKAEGFFDYETYGSTSELGLDGTWERLIRSSIRRLIENQHALLSAAHVEGADEELAWARWMFGLGDPPDPELAKLVLPPSP